MTPQSAVTAVALGESASAQIPSSSSIAVAVHPLPLKKRRLSFRIHNVVEVGGEDVGKKEAVDAGNFGEHLKPIRDGNSQNDHSRVMGPEEHLRLGQLTKGKQVAHQLLNVPTIQQNTCKPNISESSGSRTKVESCATEKRTLEDFDGNAPSSESCGMNAFNTEAFVEGVDDAKSMGYAAKGKLPSEYSVAVNIHQMSKRLKVPQGGPIDDSIEFTGGDERKMVVCAFYSKGWCVKGNLCSFLHIKERTTGPLSRSMCSDDWEQSVSFCPSHIITQKLFSELKSSNPVCGSTGLTNVKDGVSKLSYDSNKTNWGSGEQAEQVQKNESEADKVIQKNDTHVDLQNSGCSRKEPKELRHFRAVLVDFVKDLVKPAWMDGLLSKSAHNLIVKKTVDKVICSFKPNRIPSTSETIKSYIHTSLPKIEKVVVAYIEKLYAVTLKAKTWTSEVLERLITRCPVMDKTLIPLCMIGV